MFLDDISFHNKPHNHMLDFFIITKTSLKNLIYRNQKLQNVNYDNFVAILRNIFCDKIVDIKQILA